MTSPLEVAFLLANLRAAGLMPECDFQRLNPGLIELIRRKVYRETESDHLQTSLEQFLDPRPEGKEPVSYDEWSSLVRDEDLWKHVIAIFLTLKKEVEAGPETSLAQFMVSDDDIALNMIVDGGSLPASPLFAKHPGLFDSLELRSYEISRGASREALADLSRKVDALERQIADLRGQGIRSDFRDDHAAPHIHSRDAEDERAKKNKIAELQDDLNRELRSAAFYDRDGDAFNAGSAKARAAKIESKLRALGA
ncbi:MAG: hypothetical protein U1E37_05955 [Sphingomonadaceae bacterium]